MKNHVFWIFATVLVVFTSKCHTVNLYASAYDCGPYGFKCDGMKRLRLCEDNTPYGPRFLCPLNTFCDEESPDVCVDNMNYIDPALTKTVKCHQNERIADPTVQDCKGYILCISNKNRIQAIRFKCGGNTIFNGVTRSCSSPVKYKCPLVKSNKTQEIFSLDKRTNTDTKLTQGSNSGISRPIDCKNYKFSLTKDDGPVKVTYFCPRKPPRSDGVTRCTLFSNHFCLTLEREDEDQFAANTGSAFRSPRVYS